MANEGDIASQAAEFDLEVAMRKHEEGKGRRLVSTGFCLNCHDPVADKAFYCSSECREDHEKRLHLRGF